uniref:Ribosomal protein L32 n=1 Tax=Ancoracysta twista TaxID=2044563 RepID=A0A2H4R8R6_9EUKA|nr:ribosomal protein L32 [Ancoracysta twista]ATY40908.1 ribosomal protein L32 [Ancoracysta twista]
MAVPKKKVTSSRRGMRNSHRRLKQRSIKRCIRCHRHLEPHHRCFCGDSLKVLKTQ